VITIARSLDVVAHIEYFFGRVDIGMLFDGPGLQLERPDARRFAA